MTNTMKVVIMVLSLITGTVAFAAQGSLKTIEFVIDQRERNALLYIPANRSRFKGDRPLVLMIHGSGGAARGMPSLTRFRFHTLANHDGAYVVYPNAYKKMWGFGEAFADTARDTGVNDETYFKALLNKLAEDYPIDRNKLFITGISQGGSMSYFLACRFPGQVKALAPVAMSLPKAFKELCADVKDMPLLLMNGDADPVVPYRGGKVTFLGRKYGSVLSTSETVSFWRKLNGCTKDVETDSLNRALNDKTWVERKVWRNCHRAPVVLYRIKKGGHAWPGGRQYLPKALVGRVSREIDAADEIWRFFRLFF
ncbi:MAG: hypothetical protein CSA09_00715 [Candidatus Contendobacter odensis]|uniref:Phospholipase/carboxylesterase/thioesterase domain-containing protein n=1 Tax=Candidatus Contendibacter odensensis TaxID=1400860 RepID=A0A2G6PG02_9GAMM|nr:MAG: hypothetical protein CSA09_00715 [Candidatus Contendobacter odensis]